jgi:hypothetical protein
MDELALTGPEVQRWLKIGRTRLWELTRMGAIVSYKHGRSRRYDAASVRNYHARLVEANIRHVAGGQHDPEGHS